MRPMRLSVHALARLTWVACTALFVGVGIGLIWWPSTLAIDALQRHGREAYEQTRDDDAILARGSGLVAMRARVGAELARFARRRQNGLLIAGTLQDVYQIAVRHHARIVKIAPDASAAIQDRRAVLEASGGLTIVLRGRYPDLIACIAEVARGDVILGLSRVELSLADGDDHEHPLLDATLHTTVYRVHFDPPAATARHVHSASV